MSLRVLALVPYPLGRVPSQRFRLEQWAPLMEREGVRLEFSPYLSADGFSALQSRAGLHAKAAAVGAGVIRRLRDAARTGAADVVLVHREAMLFGPAWLESLIARQRPVVFDLDDAIYLPGQGSPNSWARWLRPATKTAQVCRLARHVTAGNSWLAEYARLHNGSVTVVPTSIDTDAYAPGQRRVGNGVVVGWSGSSTTVPYLATIHGALRRVERELGCELRVIGGELSLDGVTLRCRPWRSETEVEDLRGLDIGLMPLADDEWSRGKCGLKALQYMALGIPPVVSPVGVNASIVENGVNGFHASSEEEWIERIVQLGRDPDLRHRMGAVARRTVEERYSARVQAPRMARVLREAAG